MLHGIEAGDVYHEPSTNRTVTCMIDGTLIIRPGHSRRAYISGSTLIVPPFENIVSIPASDSGADHSLPLTAVKESQACVAAPPYPVLQAMHHQTSAGALAAQDSISLQDLQAPKLQASSEMPTGDSAHGSGLGNGCSVGHPSPKKEPGV
jgi:hypothetical protein